MQSTLPEVLPKEHGPVDLAPDLFVDDLDRLRTRFLTGGTAATDGQLLLIGRRQLRSNNSWMHNSQRLMRGKSRCTVMINPGDAERLDVKSGDIVTLSSRVGQVSAPAEVTGDMMAGVVSLPHGFGHGREGVQLSVATNHAGVSVNDLTDDQLIDALSGNASFSGVPVTLETAAQIAAPPETREPMKPC
jgi:anaerobic selenocysteine-containing dehydrogenase